MPRRPRQPAPGKRSPKDGRDGQPFGELAALRGRITRNGRTGPAPPDATGSLTPSDSAPADPTPRGAALPPDGAPTTPEANDASLFRATMADVIPLKDDQRAEIETPPPRAEPVKRSDDERAALRESLEAPITFEDRLEMGDEAAFLRPGLPRRVLIDLRRGRWVLQDEVDLHGLTRDQAREALAKFLAASLRQGRRCVRVIHGKGLRSPGRESILKHLSRGWLAQREEVLAFCQAGPHEGGSGALLVLIRAGKTKSGTP